MPSSKLTSTAPAAGPSLSDSPTTGSTPLSKSSLTLPSPPSPTEARCYYYGLPSAPVLVARTGTTPWKVPTGPEAYLVDKELRPVGNHMINTVWEDDMALRLHTLLDSKEVKWTSTDVVRHGSLEVYSGPLITEPVILWIGVVPKSLSHNDGVIVASQCQELLLEYDIADVDVEIRESVVTCSAGPKLLKPAYCSDDIVDGCEPLTTTLSLPICAQSTPWSEGAGGFFITEGGNTKQLLLITARHIIFPPDQDKNDHFEHKADSQNYCNILLFSDTSFTKYLESIKYKIEGQEFLAKYQEACIGSVGQQHASDSARERSHAQAELEKAKKARAVLRLVGRSVRRARGWVILKSTMNKGGLP
jgi:hypothetical protein